MRPPLRITTSRSRYVPARVLAGMVNEASRTVSRLRAGRRRGTAIAGRGTGSAFIGIPKAVSGLAAGMVETAREVGGALGTASLLAVGFNVGSALVAVLVLRPTERNTSPNQLLLETGTHN